MKGGLKWPKKIQTGRNRHQTQTGLRYLESQGMAATDAIPQIGVGEETYYRWRKEYRGMAIYQLKRLKEVEKENQRLRKAVSDLTLDKLILKEAISGKY